MIITGNVLIKHGYPGKLEAGFELFGTGVTGGCNQFMPDCESWQCSHLCSYVHGNAILLA